MFCVPSPPPSRQDKNASSQQFFGSSEWGAPAGAATYEHTHPTDSASYYDGYRGADATLPPPSSSAAPAGALPMHQHRHPQPRGPDFYRPPPPPPPPPPRGHEYRDYRAPMPDDHQYRHAATPHSHSHSHPPPPPPATATAAVEGYQRSPVSPVRRHEPEGYRQHAGVGRGYPGERGHGVPYDGMMGRQHGRDVSRWRSGPGAGRPRSNRKTIPCKFFANNACRKGDACAFSHDLR